MHARTAVVALLAIVAVAASPSCRTRDEDSASTPAPAATGDGSGSSEGTSSSSSGGAVASGGTSGTSGDPPPPPGPPEIRFIGRFDSRDPRGPIAAWPGTRIIARFRGTSVSVRLDDRADDWMDGGPSEWDVTIDGRIQTKLVLDHGEHEYALEAGLPLGPHEDGLYKRSEAQNGTTQLLGFDFGPGGALLPPPPRATRRIEIIGDSTPAAFGIEGVGPHCGLDKAARFQNFHRSFGAKLGEIFGAEVQGTVYSGKGMVRNIWRPDLETMPRLYGRADPIVDTSTFPLASFVPDAIVVMIGGLDFAVGQPTDNGPTPLAEFTATYTQFLETLRAAYPSAQILAVVSPSVVDYDGRPIRTSLTAGVTSAVDRRHAAGDVNVTLVAPPLATDAELTGCDGHGNPGFHDRLARDLAAVVSAKTGWKQ